MGGFRILPTVLPPYSRSSSIKLKGFDCNNKQLLRYVGGVAFELPVLKERPATFGLRITLYKEDEGYLAEQCMFNYFTLIRTLKTVKISCSTAGSVFQLFTDEEYHPLLHTDLNLA